MIVEWPDESRVSGTDSRGVANGGIPSGMRKAATMVTETHEERALASGDRLGVAADEQTARSTDDPPSEADRLGEWRRPVQEARSAADVGPRRHLAYLSKPSAGRL